MEKKAVRVAYGEALVKLGETNEKVVVLDADLASATMTNAFKKAFPDRFYDCGIAEANMVDMAAGISTMGLIPFCSTFAVFAGRVFDGDADDVLSVPVAGAKVSVGNRSDETDADGCFRIVFPLAEQSETKSVTLNREGYQTVTREDESPSSELMYLMHRP